MVYDQHVCVILPHVTYLWDNFMDIYRTNSHMVELMDMKRNFGSSSGRTSFGEFQPI
jgi:hypothetical protein